MGMASGENAADAVSLEDKFASVVDGKQFDVACEGFTGGEFAGVELKGEVGAFAAQAEADGAGLLDSASNQGTGWKGGGTIVVNGAKDAGEESGAFG
jgi:hypothetical protein